MKKAAEMVRRLRALILPYLLEERQLPSEAKSIWDLTGRGFVHGGRRAGVETLDNKISEHSGELEGCIGGDSRGDS